MRQLFLLLTIYLFFSCSSSEDELSPLTISELLTQNAWVYDRTEIIDITSHGNLTYQEAEQVVPIQIHTNQDTYSFDNDGTGTLVIYSSNGGSGSQTFSWVILPDGNLRLFNMGTFNDEATVFELTVNNELLTLTDDQEFLYQGTLIKYIAKSFFSKK